MIDYKKKYLKYKKKYLMAKKMYGGKSKTPDEQKLEGLVSYLQKLKTLQLDEQGERRITEVEKEIADLKKKLDPETPVVESETDKSEGWGTWLYAKGSNIAVTAATNGLNKIYGIGKKIYDKSQYSNQIMDILNKEVGDDQEKKNEIIKSIDDIYKDIKSIYDNYAQNVMKEQLNIDIKQYLKRYKNQKKTPHWYEKEINERLTTANNEMKAVLANFKKDNEQKKSIYDYAENIPEVVDKLTKEFPNLEWKDATEGRVEELIADHIRQKLLQFMETTSGYDLGIAGINDPTTIGEIMSTFSGAEGLEAIANAISLDNLFEEVVGLAASAAGIAGGQKTIKKN